MIINKISYTELRDFKGYYISSTTQQVYRDSPEGLVVCSQCPNSKSDPYPTVTVYSEGKRYKRNVHRLLALTFIPNPQGKAHVNHIDGDKTNNALDNLEWATPSENAVHAVSTGLTTYTHMEKSVHQYNVTTGDYLASYVSGHEAARQSGVAAQNIGKVCLGERGSAGGYIWDFIKVNEVDPLEGRALTMALRYVNAP